MRTRHFLFILCFFLLSAPRGFAQKNEIGICAGVLNYTGELSPDYSIVQVRQSLYGFFKKNFSPAFGLKLTLLEGELYANDKYSNDPLPAFRKMSTTSTVVEFGLIGDYNFFNYRKKGDRRRFSPYLSGGLAVYLYSQDSQTRQQISDGTGLAIPFGVGVKYQVSRRVNLGLECIARKTFTDKLDGISSYKTTKGKELGDPHGNDWYYFTGLTLSYIFYTIDCPQPFR